MLVRVKILTVHRRVVYRICVLRGQRRGRKRGCFGWPHPFFKARAIDSKLPDMYKQLAALQREIDELKKKVEGQN
jgi:hypothetical protein